MEQAEKDKTALEGRVGELEDAVTKYQNFVAELMKLLLEAERYFNQSGLQLESAVRRWGDAGGQRDIATVMAGTKEAVARVLDFYMPRDERAMEAGEGGRGGV